MFFILLQVILNLFFPLKIKAPKGAIRGCSLFKLRLKAMGGGVISVANGNILQFTDDFLGGELKGKTKIVISGKNNKVVYSLQTMALHPCLEVGGEDNRVSIGKGFRPFSPGMCWYWFGKRNVLTIGEGVIVPNNPRIAPNFNRISMGGEDCSITIKNNCTIGLNIVSGFQNACKDWHLECGEKTQIGGVAMLPYSPCKVTIGAHSQLSWNVLIGCGSHALIDESGNCTNVCQGVEVGDHVWIGTGVVIPGTVKIPNGCIVGSNAVVTKSFEEENCILGGIPAKVIKRNVKWINEWPIMYLRGMEHPLNM